MSSIEELLNLLEEKASVLRKAQINLKKCPKQRLTRGYIEIRLKSIDEDWQTFKSYHQALVKCTPKEKRQELQYFANEDYYIIEDLYLVLTGDLKDMLMTYTKAKDVNATEPFIPPQLKLPSIQLPTFTGNYDDWPTFNDLFTSLVHYNTTLTKVQKLHYLKSSVAGEAEALLKHVQVTENNYEQAWDIIKHRYGNKRLIVNAILKRLFGQRKITAPTSGQIKNLLDTTTECLNSLRNLSIPTDTWDPIIIYLVVQKLDLDSHKAWEERSYESDSETLPTWENMKKFLEIRFRTMELSSPSTSTGREFVKPVKEKSFYTTNATQIKNCVMCDGNHRLCHCDEILKLDPKERSEFVRGKNLCFNCLDSGHIAMNCRRGVCKVCNRRHHTLLHETKNYEQSDNLPNHYSHVDDDNKREEPEPVETSEKGVELSSHIVTKKSTALLPTALIPVKNEHGQVIILRALIDQGSQANFISERAAQLLKIKRTRVSGTVTGVGSTKTDICQVAQLQLFSRYESKFQLTIKAYVLSTQLTTQLPSRSFEKALPLWSHLQSLYLADPDFNLSRRIDLLLGVEVYAQILKNNCVTGPPGSPCAQETSFGWILFGNVHLPSTGEEIVVMHHRIEEEDIFYKLWDIDNDDRNKLTKQEELCERIYKETHRRNEEGRYIVKLPLKTEPPKSTEGHTREIALKRLHHMERRFKGNSNLKSEYRKVMMEYIDLEHMEPVPESEMKTPSVYLPHHAVIKDTSDTTKVRVVFNASCPGNNNVSLNDDLLIGPQLQEDMRSLVMRWRLKRIGFVADVEKMYRQILVTKEDADYQRILWRIDPSEPVKDYRLLRVTFGTASAPYLAVKTLQQVAEDEGEGYPLALETIRADFFMDDLMSGQDTDEEAVEVAKNVTNILRKGGFALQKWASNSAVFLKEFPPEKISSRVKIEMNAAGTVRILGLSWNLGDDTLQYCFDLPPSSASVTKRSILANIQHLFDPLGWLCPALLPAKLLIQKLWLSGVTWDEEISSELKEEWEGIRQSLEAFNEIRIDRWLNSTKNVMKDASVHGFCDASSKAYGAVAYLRVKTEDGEHQTALIAARSRVAPVKPVSLPRLELCGAVLLSKLLKQIHMAMRISKKQIFAWTDSTIVLAWLRGDPARWQTFVRNRVVTIIDNIGHKWHHVTSQDNPADVASRGMLLPELANHNLWWQGPHWLTQEKIELHGAEVDDVDLEKRENWNVNTITEITNKNENYLLTKFEDFDTLLELQKTVVFCKRFLNLKNNNNIDAPFTPHELDEALMICVKITQANDFKNEIMNLVEGKSITSKSTLKSLNPYLDDKGLLRVGGRLRHAQISENQKHPIILSSRCRLAKLIVADGHRKTLHGGIQLTMNYIRTRFWILRVKTIVSSTIHKCLTCARQRATHRRQIMGDLPEARVTPARPFFRSGVDFAGPLQISKSKGRGIKCEKAYICIFVCMATKAIHLELVGDMSTDGFLGAFKRFTARRGRCAHVWSDRGTNFVGANRELNELWHNAKLELPENLINLLAEDGTEWHFNPPYSPNFGGLWEAGVKSIKYHLKRILNTHLTFEEMSTTLCQIEACLNSRPLSPIHASDTDQVNVLTPGHFLIGEAPINIPEPNLTDVQLNRLSRWQHTQKLVQNFWHRWQNEYLTRLQQRPKWMKPKREFSIGEIVLIKEENLPPSKWALGRIIEKHSGHDNFCRVYSLKCGDKIVQRSISKLCEFPVNTN